MFAPLIAIACLVTGVALAGTIGLWRAKRPDLLYVFIYLTVVIKVLPYLLMELPVGAARPYLFWLPVRMVYLTFPLLYVYTRRVLQLPRQRFGWLHFLPAAIEFVGTSIVFAQQAGGNPWFTLSYSETLIDTVYILSLPSLLLYSYHTAKLLWAADTLPLAGTAKASSRQIRGLWVVLVLILVFFVQYLIFSLGPLSNYISVEVYQSAAMILFAVVVGYLGVFGLQEVLYPPAVPSPTSAVIPQLPVLPPPTEGLPSLSPAKSVDRLGDIIDYLVESEAYLDPGLSAGELARRVHVSRRTLSRIIKDSPCGHYNHFVNRFRIEAAKRLLTDLSYQNHSMERIGTLTGFRTKSSFYRSFRALTGESPASYRQKNLRGSGDNRQTV